MFEQISALLEESHLSRLQKSAAGVKAAIETKSDGGGSVNIREIAGVRPPHLADQPEGPANGLGRFWGALIPVPRRGSVRHCWPWVYSV
jgi:hypothetical protein